MLTDGLFDRVLLAPAKNLEINRLQIVSGYATAGLASRHMHELEDVAGDDVAIELIIGMTKSGGMVKAQHLAMKTLVREHPHGTRFSCRYVIRGGPVHAKVYIWMKDDHPKLAYAGSANYTAAAFREGSAQVEAMAPVDPEDAADFYKRILPFTENCADDVIESEIALKEEETIGRPEGAAVNLTLLSGQGETPRKSGINWGQREGRERNQAYINIPADIGKSDFFPERYERFAVRTDDGKSFIMVRAQDEGKGLETPHNNSLLGKYLRERIGVRPGACVTRKHLEEYGRTDITFIKIDNETYRMDFSSDGDRDGAGGADI